MKITSEKKGAYLRIYINGSLHLQLRLPDLVSVHSYIDKSLVFYIEYYFVRTDKMVTTYWEREPWIEMLKILEENLLA